MKRSALIGAAVLSVAIGGSAFGAAKPTPIPTLKSPAGKVYKAGQICPGKDLNKKSHSTGKVIIKCERVGKYLRWEHVSG